MHLLRYISSALLTWSLGTGQACTNCTNESSDPIEHVPAPWTLKGTIYSFFLLPALGVSLDGSLPIKAFPPLERQDPNATAGFKGRLGMIQLIRYTESPVGPYDEMLIVPGYFQTPVDESEQVRVSRIYVSQKYTNWNGRYNWNIPKHLAHFDWSTDASGHETVKVYPFDTTGDKSESWPASKPWFQATIQQTLLGRLLPLPFSTNLYSYLGVDATLVQPPLPQGNDSLGALTAGTPTWKATVPGQRSNKGRFVTFDLAQGEGDAVGTNAKGQRVNAVGDEVFDNFWPGLLRWTSGSKMEDATITFSDPVVYG